MAVSEPDRLDLYRGLEEKLGKRRAETFMNLVTRVPWTDVATKGDLVELRAATKRDLVELRAATKRDFVELRADTRRDLAELRADTKGGLGVLRADMEKALRGQLLAFITVVAVLNGLIFAGLRLL